MFWAAIFIWRPYWILGQKNDLALNLDVFSIQRATCVPIFTNFFKFWTIVWYFFNQSAALRWLLSGSCSGLGSGCWWPSYYPATVCPSSMHSPDIKVWCLSRALLILFPKSDFFSFFLFYSWDDNCMTMMNHIHYHNFITTRVLRNYA